MASPAAPVHSHCGSPEQRTHETDTFETHTPLSIWAFSAALKILSAETQPTVEVQLNAEENYWFAPLAEGPPSRGRVALVGSKLLIRAGACTELTHCTGIDGRVLVRKLLSSNYE